MSENKDESKGFSYSFEPKNPIVQKLMSSVEKFFDETQPTNFHLGNHISGMLDDIDNRGRDPKDYKRPTEVSINGTITYDKRNELVDNVVEADKESKLKLSNEDIIDLKQDNVLNI